MAKVIELYVCCMCGITNETHKHWGPICKKTGKRVCDECCYRCEYHVSWSGIWRCKYVTPEDRREDVQRRIRERFEEEERKISEAYNRRRREEARQRAIKKAKAAKKARQNPGGRY